MLYATSCMSHISTPYILLRRVGLHLHLRAPFVSAGLLSVETYTCCESPPTEQQLHELLSVVDIFSPNLAEAASIVGPGTPVQLVRRLLQLGAQLVALRMGEDGVLLARVQPDGHVEECEVHAGTGGADRMDTCEDIAAERGVRRQLHSHRCRIVLL